MPLHAPSARESTSRGGAQHGLARDGGVAFDLERLVLTLPEARTGFYHVHAQALAKIWEPFWCERQKAPESERGSLTRRRPTRTRAIKSYRFAVRRRSFISVPLPGPSSTSCARARRAPRASRKASEWRARRSHSDLDGCRRAHRLPSTDAPHSCRASSPPASRVIAGFRVLSLSPVLFFARRSFSLHPLRARGAYSRPIYRSARRITR